MPDSRPPNVVRLAPVALCTGYSELWDTVQALRAIVDGGAQRRFSAVRSPVGKPLVR